MKKKKKDNLTKEVIIMLLLAIIILLIMIVALYDFKPNSVIIPEVVEYSSDAKTSAIKQEINYTNGGDATADGDVDSVLSVLKSYNIDAVDLTVYSQKSLYNSGNSNPFEYIQEEEQQQPGTGNTVNPGEPGTGSPGTPAQPGDPGNGGGETPGTFFENTSSK